MSENFTLIAFDFGMKRIGVAVGQTLTGTASPLPPLPAQNGQPDWNALEKVLKAWSPARLVVGLPLNMDGTEQPLTVAAKKFAARLHGRFGHPVDTIDERLSTVAVREELFAQGGYRALQKKSVDSRAACLILEGWFERRA